MSHTSQVRWRLFNGGEGNPRPHSRGRGFRGNQTAAAKIMRMCRCAATSGRYDFALKCREKRAARLESGVRSSRSMS